MRPNEVKKNLPEWTTNADGDKKWQEWVESQVKRCCSKGRKSYAKHGINRKTIGSCQWRKAIVKAIQRAKGCAYYSSFPLSLDESRGRDNTHPMWPSIDHVDGPNIPNLVLETRIVNDMKSILSRKEFEKLIGHLTKILKLKPKKLPSTWTCKRDFKGATRITRK